MYDVIEISNRTNKILRVIAENKNLRDAEAIVDMAVMRRGVGESFFTYVEAGKYMAGEQLFS